MSRPTKIEQLEKAGISTVGLSKEDIRSEWLKLPADGYVKKALLKYGISGDNLSGVEAQEVLSNITNLRVCSNILKRIEGFADISTSEYILCSLSCLKNKSLYNLYKKISKSPVGDGMLYDWLHMIGYI